MGNDVRFIRPSLDYSNFIMKTTLSSDAVVAYSICNRKAYLLLFTKEQGENVEFLDILNQKIASQKNNYEFQGYISSAVTQIKSLNDLKKIGDVIFNINIEFENFQVLEFRLNF
jgi:hypothetical protein